MEEGSRIERREEESGGEEEELSPFMVKTVFALKVSLQTRPLRLFSSLRDLARGGKLLEVSAEEKGGERFEPARRESPASGREDERTE